MSRERERDPVLNIQAVDPFDPQPTIFQLKFDTPKEFEGKYGTQYIYSIRYDGKDHVLFASAALDERIGETGAKKDDYVAVVRTGEGKDTRWTARLVDAQGRPIQGGGPRKPQEAQEAPSRGGGGGQAQAAPAKPPERPYDERLADFLMDEQLYFGSMKRAETMLGKDRETNLDLNAVAFVLYRMAKDHGIELDGTGDPMPPAEPELTEEQAKQRQALIDALASRPLSGGDTVVADDPQVAADALAIVRRNANQPDWTWADVTREEALHAHRLIKAAATYEDALTGGALEDPPF